ncbi:AMP-binding protein [Streptomyces sp. Tue 6430]|nr:AMP-binding protein [Streptomyces sp. Tue 6430]
MAAPATRHGRRTLRPHPSQGCGYWGEPALSAEVFTDGWVRTRDIGHLDREGRLRLTGRARDVIIVNAHVYYSGPVERVLATHPAVGEAYVVAAPDDSTGEAVHAFVVPAPGRVPRLGELRALVAAELGEATAPTRLTLIDEVPLTPAGKPDKRALAAGVSGPVGPVGPVPAARRGRDGTPRRAGRAAPCPLPPVDPRQQWCRHHGGDDGDHHQRAEQRLRHDARRQAQVERDELHQPRAFISAPTRSATAPAPRPAALRASTRRTSPPPPPGRTPG